MDFSLIIPAFIAGVLTFLAPCTLPLVPGYLGFISGVSVNDLRDLSKAKIARRKIFLNGVLYVIGFSLVFIILGSLFGLGGAVLFKYRFWLSRIGGIFIIFFGLFMMGALKLPFLNVEKHVGNTKALKPGNPISSLIFGATFAFGWTPCVGPILGSILTLAASSATIGQGAFLLTVFSLGLATPFLIIAASISSASMYLLRTIKYLRVISVLGGAFLVFLGILLLTNKLGVWISYAYQWFDFINYESLLDYL
ncbi:MAG: cytochrome c biogenesis protein CcdA [Patescibacteria group bacterium]